MQPNRHFLSATTVPRTHSARRGAIAVLAAFCTVVILIVVVFAVDLGYMSLVRTELQSIADAAALAGGSQLLDRSLLTGGSDQSAGVIAARKEAQKFAEQNRAGGKTILLDTNLQNSTGGDIVVGYLSNPSHPQSTLSTKTTPFNAVSVTARRSAYQNGALELFFGSVLGHKSTSVSATATAVLEGQVGGFYISGNNPLVQTSKLLPFAMNVSDWNKVAGGHGQDVWKYDSLSRSFSAGKDDIKETRLYGSTKTTAGNFGTVDIGKANNSTADVVRQILYGPNKSDFDAIGGKLELGPLGTMNLQGDPGLSAGFKAALETIIGQPRIIPLYDQVTGNGNRAQYRIVGFAGITIAAVQLTGPQKYVTVQPEFVVDPTAVGGHDWAADNGFVYRPLQLAR